MSACRLVNPLIASVVLLALVLGLAHAQQQPEPNPAPPCPEGYTPKRRSSAGEEKPPVLRRGVPEEYKHPPEPGAEDEVECVWSETLVSEGGKVIETRIAAPGSDELIEKARQKVYDFSETLPDFICDQITGRYFSKSRPPKWKFEDRISAEVLYVQGKERYQNIRRNGKPLRTGRPETTGAWSYGEFGTVMQDLFSPSTHARFTEKGTDKIGGVQATLYEYSVERESSHWRVEFEGQVLQPAYQGSIWIDPDSHRAFRIEMQAREIPLSFPLDVIEMTVDYGPVEIAGQSYLMPTRSENLTCKRYTNNCSRNELEFRNYRKFTAESIITTTDSTITYEGKSDSPAAPRK